MIFQKKIMENHETVHSIHSNNTYMGWEFSGSAQILCQQIWGGDLFKMLTLEMEGEGELGPRAINILKTHLKISRWAFPQPLIIFYVAVRYSTW